MRALLSRYVRATVCAYVLGEAAGASVACMAHAQATVPASPRTFVLADSATDGDLFCLGTVPRGGLRCVWIADLRGWMGQQRLAP